MKVFLFILLIAFCPIFLFAEGVNLNYEFNRYKYNKDSTFLEFAFSFDQEHLGFVQDKDLFISNLNISFSLVGLKNKIEKDWDVVIQSSNPIEKKGKIFIGVKQLFVPNDQYKISVKLIDRNKSKNSENKESSLAVLPFSESSIELSDLELAYSIEKVDNISATINNEYVKNDLYIIPNPSSEIAGVKPLLNIYSEIYNCNENIDSLSISYTILNSMKIKILNNKKSKIRTSSDFYEYNQMLLDTLPSGLYYVDLEIMAYADDKIIAKTSKTKKIYLMNPQRNPYLNTYFSDDELYSRSEFATLTDEQCDEEFKQIIYIASMAEREIWSKLTDYTGKKKYLYAFWNNRKSDKNNKVNMERQEFKRLIEYANLYYSVGTPNSGWKTDRGRVLLKYGKPSNTDTYPAMDGNKAYEVWIYDSIDGGVKFYFVDVRQNGRFSLVHSTMFEEIQNANWESQFLKQTR